MLIYYFCSYLINVQMKLASHPNEYNFLALTRPGKTDPRPKTRIEQPESIPEPISEMKTTGFDLNTQSNPTHNRTELKIEHDPK